MGWLDPRTQNPKRKTTGGRSRYLDRYGLQPVEFSQPSVHERVIATQEIQHAAILAEHALDKQLDLALERLRVGLDRLHGPLADPGRLGRAGHRADAVSDRRRHELVVEVQYGGRVLSDRAVEPGRRPPGGGPPGRQGRRRAGRRLNRLWHTADDSRPDGRGRAGSGDEDEGMRQAGTPPGLDEAVAPPRS